MIILGIDPGLATLGFGIVSYDNVKAHMVDYGVLSTKAGVPLPARLSSLFEGISDLLARHQPDDIAIEELFFNTNVTTAIAVGEARGAVIAACAAYSPNIFEYTPLQIKQAITGYGRADKQQVQMMVKMLLSLQKTPKPDDAADALAVAICHAHSLRMRENYRMK
ncbi:MAG: crossover junction endodeoxyribonuclease RuvC [Christensenellales bacterium]|jgi:crossover junction endodeoxyribonuclease RuvC